LNRSPKRRAKMGEAHVLNIDDTPIDFWTI